jgi:hypothetical protein
MTVKTMMMRRKAKMIELVTGQEIPVGDALKGNSNRGPYFKTSVRPEKGKDRIDIWATNPEEAINFTGMAKVVEIQKVKKSAHQYNGRWYDDYTVEAKLAQGNPEEVMFTPLDADKDDDLPFA